MEWFITYADKRELKQTKNGRERIEATQKGWRFYIHSKFCNKYFLFFPKRLDSKIRRRFNVIFLIGVRSTANPSPDLDLRLLLRMFWIFGTCGFSGLPALELDGLRPPSCSRPCLVCWRARRELHRIILLPKITFNYIKELLYLNHNYVYKLFVKSMNVNIPSAYGIIHLWISRSALYLLNLPRKW